MKDLIFEIIDTTLCLLMLFHIMDSSHIVIFPYYLVFNMIIMASFGKNIINSHGSKAFWLLYLGGAISGGLCMQMFRPNNSIVIP